MNRLIANKGFVFILLALFSCNTERSEYYENGKIKRECEIKGGFINGLCEEFYDDGNILSRSYWLNDTLNGLATIFYKNGIVKQKVPWLKGKIHGVFLSYHENGKIKQRSKYKNGILNGKLEVFYENGRLSITVNYKNGNKIGEGKYYHRNGNIEEIQQWITAEGINFTNTRKEYDSLGNLIFEDHYAIITPVKDSVTIEDKYKIKIELKNPVYEKMEVLIGDFDEEYDLNDSLSIDTIRSEGFTAEYSFKPKKEGVNLLRGYIIDYKEKKNVGGGKNIELQKYYFRHPYYVKPKIANERLKESN